MASNRVTGFGVRWTLVPLLAAGGYASAIYTTLLPFRIAGETSANYHLYLALGSATLGLTLLAILWYRRHIRSWPPAAAFLTLVLAAHGFELALFALTRGSGPMGDLDLPIVGTVDTFRLLTLFLTVLVIVVGTVIIVFPQRRHVRTPMIAVACAVTVTFVAAWLEASQRGAWITFWDAQPLWLFWQTSIAAAVGFALWVADRALPPGESKAPRPVEDA